jgi:hypothetical protein
MKKSLKIVLASIATIIVVIAGGFALLCWAMFSDHSSYSEHLAVFEGLPPTASDITVYTNRNITGTVVAEFAIREADFVTWAEKNQWGVTEIVAPIEIGNPQAYHQGDPNRRTKVERGLYASHRRSNGGGIDVAYDRAKSKGLISRSSR